MKRMIANFKLLAIETENQIALTHGLLSDFKIEVLEEINAKDDYIDNLKTVVENDCFSSIYTMTRSPDMAPLNRLRALQIICVNLERIADFCVNIARQTQYLTSKDFIQAYDYDAMFQVIQRSIRGIDQAFDHGNLSQAMEICRAEFRLDDLWEKTFKILLEDLKKKEFEVTNLVTTIFIFRYLERIGDSILNIGEALIFAIMGDRIKIRQVEALEKTLTASGFPGNLGDIDFSSIWGSRSGCRISKVSRKKPSGFKAQGIFKEGDIGKIKKERANIKRWETIYPGLAPKVFGYYEKYRTASLLVEFLPGCTLDQVILTETLEMVDNVLYVFEQTLMEVWHITWSPVSCHMGYMAQLQERLGAISRVHPACFQGTGGGAARAGGFVEPLMKQCRALEKELFAPFSVFIHGDFNTNNIVYSHDEERIHYIDLYRSRMADYVQDVAVFLASNFRASPRDREQRERLNRVNRHFYGVFSAFARKHKDATFGARLALAMARCFLTSMRFELKKSFALEMFRRARTLMEQLLLHDARRLHTFEFPADLLVYLPGQKGKKKQA